MKRFRVELVFALALAALVALFWRGQEPNRPLTEEESGRYIAIIDQQFPFASPDDRADALVRLRAFAARDDGRDVYMLNLLRFHDKLKSGSAIPADYQGTPRDANKLYEQNALPIALKNGAFPIFLGAVAEPNVMGAAEGEDNWSRIIVMHYPSRRHFFELLTDPGYLKKAAYKSYAMHIALVPMQRELAAPDLRWLAAGGALVIFLIVALVRALLRKAA